MSKSKSIAKSIRMTDDIFNYINDYRGSGFNAKFENIIFDAMCSELDRQVILSDLDNRIASSKKEYLAICDKLSAIQSLHREFLRLQHIFLTLSDKLEVF